MPRLLSDAIQEQIDGFANVGDPDFDPMVAELRSWHATVLDLEKIVAHVLWSVQVPAPQDQPDQIKIALSFCDFRHSRTATLQATIDALTRGDPDFPGRDALLAQARKILADLGTTGCSDSTVRRVREAVNAAIDPRKYTVALDIHDGKVVITDVRICRQRMLGLEGA